MNQPESNEREMNILTSKIKAKGYTLKEFLLLINYSLSTWRKYEHRDRLTTENQIKRHEFFVNKVTELESRI